MNGLRQALVVCRKEVVDNLRDRRSVAMACMGPILCVGVIGLATAFVGRMMMEATQLPLSLPVYGMERAPDLMTFLRENNVRVRAGEGAPEDLIRSGDARVVLVVPEGYGPSLRAGKPAPLRIVSDRSQNTAGAAVARLEGVLASYSSRLGALRLVARGVDHGIAQAVAVERVDLSTPQSRSGNVLNTVPFILVLSLLLGGMGVATDSTAGERERGSLEPLLINPAPRWAFVVGKLLAILCFSVGALALCVAGLALLPRVISFSDFGGAFELPALLAFGLLCPLMVTASAFQMVVASFARTYKEAQTTLSLLNLLPMVPGVAILLLSVVPRSWMFLVPVLSEELLIYKLVRGEVPEPHHMAIAVGSGVLWAALTVAAAVRLYRGERVLFGASS